ncbi:hypothetical protein [Lysobacter brunescens]|uniref:Lipoprotein n=1 Tax=Lysobacter brunescens TaxID=262323 RepID=A0ABW2Y810_9GAMM
MRLHAFTLSLIVTLIACSAPAPSAEPAPAPPSSTAAEAPPAPSPKVSAEMAGRVSPVPAFMGLGEHFNIRIQSVGDMRHDVELTWAMGQKSAQGVLMYRGAPGVPHRGPIALDGTLDTAEGAKPIRVEIVTGPCTDEADRPHPQRVTVTLEGETTLHGCGDLAVY